MWIYNIPECGQIVEYRFNRIGALMLKQRYAIMALLFATWLLGGCGGENSLQPGSPSEPQETASVTLSIYTGREISRAVGLPGDPGTSPEMPDAIENINLFMYVEPKNGAAAYMEHYYIELPSHRRAEVHRLVLCYRQCRQSLRMGCPVDGRRGDGVDDDRHAFARFICRYFA